MAQQPKWFTEKQLPPAGTRCLVSYEGQYYPCVIVGHRGGLAVFESESSAYPNEFDAALANSFKPIIEQSEKEVEEINRLIITACAQGLQLTDLANWLHQNGVRPAALGGQ